MAVIMLADGSLQKNEQGQILWQTFLDMEPTAIEVGQHNVVLTPDGGQIPRGLSFVTQEPTINSQGELFSVHIANGLILKQCPIQK